MPDPPAPDRPERGEGAGEAAERHRRRKEQVRDLRRDKQALRRQNRALRRELAKAAGNRYGSLTPGIAGWEHKWERSPGRRVLFYAPMDFAGSLFRWAIAVHRHTPYAVRLACLRRHPFGYDLDLLFGDLGLVESDFEGLAAEADIIHVKDEVGLTDDPVSAAGQVLIGSGRPIVFTHCGGDARQCAERPDYQRKVLGFAARVANTPDLCFPWFDGRYVPLPVDADRFPYSWTDGNLIAHSPSIPERKATADLVAAVAGLDCRLDVIHGVSHAECLERKRCCNLFFDQAGRELAQFGTERPIGWYANSTLEAAVHGIPAIAHLAEESFAGALRGGQDIRERVPILNTPMGADGIRETILRHRSLSPERRREVSLRTRRWIEEFHSYPAVAGELRTVYDSLS